jgi:hypothetical protein
MSLGLTDFIPIGPDSIVHAERPTPPYAKWGKIAVEKTKEKYLDAQVVDYLHVGREDKGSNSVEKFKLWLKGPDKEFGVFVDVEFNEESEQLIKISYKEVAS